jgi:hypothetical protein
MESFHHLIRVNCKSLKYRIYSKEAKKSPCHTPTVTVTVTVIPISIAAAVGRCHSPCHDHQGRDPHRLIAACTILAPRSIAGVVAMPPLHPPACACGPCPHLQLLPFRASGCSQCQWRMLPSSCHGRGACPVLCCAHPHHCARRPCPMSRHLWRWGWVGHHP